jgi:hypothetical protein
MNRYEILLGKTPPWWWALDDEPVTNRLVVFKAWKAGPYRFSLEKSPRDASCKKCFEKIPALTLRLCTSFKASSKMFFCRYLYHIECVPEEHLKHFVKANRSWLPPKEIRKVQSRERLEYGRKKHNRPVQSVHEN